MTGLRTKRQEVNYLDVLNSSEFAEVYASANVFVSPAKPYLWLGVNEGRGLRFTGSRLSGYRDD